MNFTEEWLAEVKAKQAKWKTIYSGTATLVPRETPVKKRKYRNEPELVDGIKFDSKREAARWQELKLMEKAGIIKALQRQITFELAPSVVIQGRKRPPIRYTCDFKYFERSINNPHFFVVVEDVKSRASKTTAYKLRRHLMKAVHGIEIRETE